MLYNKTLVIVTLNLKIYFELYIYFFIIPFALISINFVIFKQNKVIRIGGLGTIPITYTYLSIKYYILYSRE